MPVIVREPIYDAREDFELPGDPSTSVSAALVAGDESVYYLGYLSSNGEDSSLCYGLVNDTY